MQGCRPGSETLTGITLAHEVSPQPPRVGQVKITLKATDSSGKPVTRAQVMLEGHMTHAGMTPVSATAAESEPGRYSGVVNLSMAGDWVIVAKFNLPGQGTLQRQFEIKGVLPEQ